MEATKIVNIMWSTVSYKHELSNCKYYVINIITEAWTFILGWTIGKYKLNDKRAKDGKVKPKCTETTTQVFTIICQIKDFLG
jgi:hypothetical protein